MALFPFPTALVHEWFSPRSVGGAELVVQQLDQLLDPQLFALVDGESGRPQSWLAGRQIETSFIQKLPWGRSHVQQYLPLLPLAIEQLDLSGYPLVLSSSHLVSKGVLTSPEQLHVSYVHTPVRYAWDQMHAYLRRSRLAQSPLGPWIRWQLHQLRQWDVLSASRPDRLIANSRFTAQRIARYWGRSATVLPPPVDVERFDWQQPREDFYLSVCRLVPYKRVDLVVQACRELICPWWWWAMDQNARGWRPWLARQRGSWVARRRMRWSSSWPAAALTSTPVWRISALLQWRPWPLAHQWWGWGAAACWIRCVASAKSRLRPRGCCLRNSSSAQSKRRSRPLKAMASGGSCRLSGCACMPRASLKNPSGNV